MHARRDRVVNARECGFIALGVALHGGVRLRAVAATRSARIDSYGLMGGALRQSSSKFPCDCGHSALPPALPSNTHPLCAGDTEAWKYLCAAMIAHERA